MLIRKLYDMMIQCQNSHCAENYKLVLREATVVCRMHLQRVQRSKTAPSERYTNKISAASVISYDTHAPRISSQLNGSPPSYAVPYPHLYLIYVPSCTCPTHAQCTRRDTPSPVNIRRLHLGMKLFAQALYAFIEYGRRLLRSCVVFLLRPATRQRNGDDSTVGTVEENISLPEHVKRKAIPLGHDPTLNCPVYWSEGQYCRSDQLIGKQRLRLCHYEESAVHERALGTGHRSQSTATNGWLHLDSDGNTVLQTFNRDEPMVLLLTIP